MGEQHGIVFESVRLRWTPPWENGGQEVHAVSARCTCGKVFSGTAQGFADATDALRAAFEAHWQAVASQHGQDG